MAPQAVVDAKPARPSSLKPASVSSSQPSATAEPAKPAAEPASVNLPSAPQPVEFHGCTALRDSKDGPVCMLTPDDKLVFWVRDRACDSLAFAEGGQAISFAGSIVQGGCQARITSSTTQVHTALQINDRSTAQAIYSLSLDRSKPHLLEWKRRMWGRSLSDVEDVFSELRRLLIQQSDIESIIDITYAQAIALIRIGSLELAIRELQDTVRLASGAGYLSTAIDAARVQVSIYLRQGMHTEARALLQLMESWVIPAYSRSAIELRWHAGLIDRAQEHYFNAAEQIRDSYVMAERLQDLDFLRHAYPILVELLVSLDRLSEVDIFLNKFDYLLAGAPACQSAALLNGIAFTGLLLAQDQENGSAGSALRVGRFTIRELFDGALRSRIKCTDDGLLANLYMGLSTLEMLEGRLFNAHSWSTKARQLKGRSISTDLGLLEIDARLALKEGNASESLRIFRALDTLSRQHPEVGRTETECQVAIGMSEALRAAGQDPRSLEATVHSCLANGTKQLDPPLVRSFQRRARAVGLVAQ